jgi:manganese/iron transport system ATP-binding protein
MAELLKEIRGSSYRKTAPHIGGAAILEVGDLNVRYPAGLALDSVSFSLKTGELIAVVGPNGAGKSTLFKVIAGVMQPSSGTVTIAGHAPEGHVCISYVPQRSQVDWKFPVTVADVVMMGRVSKLGLFKWPKASDWQIVEEALDVVGLSHLSKRQIEELSGGQQQRMFIARALAQEAELMLMDEPITGLDVTSQEGIFRILRRLQEQGVTILVSMHDLNLAAERFDRILLLNKRLMGFGTPDEVFTTERLVEAYGGHLRLIEGNGSMIAVSDTCCEGDDHEHD